MKKELFLIGLLMIVVNGYTQSKKYTVANAHSHNDYEQRKPFWEAYRHGFGSVEADVFLVNHQLAVAHNAKDIRPGRELRSLYLDPLRSCIRKNNGFVYADPQKQLNLLIDCKTAGIPTLDAIIRELKEYPDIIDNKSIRIVITGNQPNKDSLFIYPAFIGFDGDLTYRYSGKNLDRVVLFSANFRDYSQWNGEGMPDSASKAALEKAILAAGQAGKPIRFWGAPDNENAWKIFEGMGVGFINTDKIAALSQFLTHRF
ncbi:alkaline phosphatase [Niabella ginsenosidivorans]|uniref:Altered inheritance of mitochondria protein 6 n=1 Tax=Niabella ginsenosidivorans TaxID=1176587 RepID=A0A1A9I143_9BACT|nr:phosphatidylinositol-specific phospholipase C/glycerophosphodiester phosphodiesterase family protein [Niabella ginsenosidivorans]ANH80412.1 alkaline phosphatase [Niabella ginsenosidivorans]